MAGAHGVEVAEVAERAERGAALGLEQRIVAPGVGPLRVRGLRNDVEVAGEDDGHLGSEERGGVRREPLHPGELVGEFLAPDGIAVGQVDGRHARREAARRDACLDVARLGIPVVAGKPAPHVLERMQSQERDAVEALLSVRCDVVAEVGKGFGREALVDGLDLLQAQHVGPGFAHVGDGALDAGADAVDVPGGDFHNARVPLQRTRFSPPPCGEGVGGLPTQAL